MKKLILFILLFFISSCNVYGQDWTYKIDISCNDNDDPDYLPTHEYVLFVTNIADTLQSPFKTNPADPMVTWAQYHYSTLLHNLDCTTVTIQYPTKDNGQWIAVAVYARSADGKYNQGGPAIVFYHKPDTRTVKKPSFRISR